MRTPLPSLLLAASCCWCEAARGQLEIVSNGCPAVFSGNRRAIPVIVRNSSPAIQESELTMRLFQTSSATAARLGDFRWKRIHVLPGQTVLETARVDFPSVRAETPFLIQWLNGTDRVIGKTEVLVYPTNLLAELKTLAGEKPIGIFDPNCELKPLLNDLAVDFVDLENAGLDHFTGKLAVIGPFAARSQVSEQMPDQIIALAKKSKAIVWILPPSESHDELMPSFFAVPGNAGCVVIAQANMVSNLRENPQSQLNLLHFAQLALKPEPPHLPQITQR